MVDRWLAGLYDLATGGQPPAGVSLVAVGGYGRGELAPESDLDLVLLHRAKGMRADAVADLADGVWYPIWDEGLKLGHSVRTVDGALALAAADLDTATSLLDIRHLAGDPAVSEELAERARSSWRADARRRLPELADSVSARHRTAGEVAYLLEPNLKTARGGLRDVHALHWARAAGVELLAGDDQRLAEGYEVLLGARVEVHRRTGRPLDLLLLEDQDAIAAALGHADADVLMAQIAAAGRMIAWVSDETWFHVRRRARTRRDRRRRPAEPVAVAPGVVVEDGEARFAAGGRRWSATPWPRSAWRSPPPRPGRGSGATTLTRLLVSPARLPDPWPDEGRELLIRLLATGPAFVDVAEALDQFGLWTRLLPEWAPVRNRPQRNAYHRFTVDRHLWEAAANAAELVGTVERPDLLLVGALLHDIGKGYPGDHTEAGIEVLGRMAPRLGFDEPDAAVRGRPLPAPPAAARRGHPAGPRRRRHHHPNLRAGR